MGNSQSSNQQKETEPVVIYPPSNASLSISPDLVNQLNGKSANGESSQELEGDQLERLVHERAQQEIKRIQLEDEKIKANLSNPKLADTQILTEYLSELVKKNTHNPIATKNSGVEAAKEALIVCYNNNPKRTLDCWQEVNNFKEAIQLAQKEFVNGQL